MHSTELHTHRSAGSTYEIVGTEHERQGTREPEVEVRAMLDAGRGAEATRAAILAHGAGIFGFLVGVLDDLELAGAIYGRVCRQIATEIEAFDGRSSLRAWLYGLGRRELKDRRLRRQGAAGGRGRVETAPIVTTSRPAGLTGAIATLRGSLSEEERELLILRIDRGFNWEELAHSGLEGRTSPAAVTDEVRRLKVRLEALFERVEAVASRHVRARPR